MREDERLQLDLVDESLREERTDRAIHHAHGEDFLLAWRTFLLAEATRVLARGGSLLAVVAGQREKVDAGAGIRADGGGEDDGLSVGREDRASGELGDLACLKAQRSSADLALNNGVCACCHVSWCLSCC